MMSGNATIRPSESAERTMDCGITTVATRNCSCEIRHGLSRPCIGRPREFELPRKSPLALWASRRSWEAPGTPHTKAAMFLSVQNQSTHLARSERAQVNSCSTANADNPRLSACGPRKTASAAGKPQAFAVTTQTKPFRQRSRKSTGDSGRTTPTRTPPRSARPRCLRD
jgi:hypothetical protein